jgi:hypothetical protein
MYVKTRSDIITYIYTVFDLLKVDDEKYHYVQLDATCYPVVMIPRCDMLGSTDSVFKIVRVVENSLDNWPAWVEPWST